MTVQGMAVWLMIAELSPIPAASKRPGPVAAGWRLT